MLFALFQKMITIYRNKRKIQNKSNKLKTEIFISLS